MKKRFLTALIALSIITSLTGCEFRLPSSAESYDENGEKAPHVTASGSIQETVLLDEGGAKITATELISNDYITKVKLNIENNSDRTLEFISGSNRYSCNSVNDYMISDGYFHCELPAGKKKTEEVGFDSSLITMFGIKDIADINIGVKVTADDDVIFQGPLNIRTSIANGYDYSQDSFQKAMNDKAVKNTLRISTDTFEKGEFYNNYGVKMISKALMKNKDGSYMLMMEFENTSSDSVYVAYQDIAVNGIIAKSGRWSNDMLLPHKKVVEFLRLDSVIEEEAKNILEIDSIGQVDVDIALLDADYEKMAMPETISIKSKNGKNSFDKSGKTVYEENGIKIISKGVADDSHEYIDDKHIILLIENSTQQNLDFDIEYDSLSINGYMTEFIAFGSEVPAGKCGFIDVRIYENDLSENSITKFENAEMTFEIRTEDYDDYANPKVSIKF